MAKDYGWNIAVPADSVTIGNVPDAIRDTRNQIESHITTEHEDFVADDEPLNAGGEHKEGSAKAYWEATDPTNRPDGSSPLAGGDAGRLWADSDNNELNVYDGSDFVSVTIAGITVADAAGDGSTKIGDLIALLPGRAGGQSLAGGTAANENLVLRATTHATHATATLSVESDGTGAIDFESVPISNVTLGGDMDVDSNDIVNIGAVATTGYALGFGNADLTADCLKVTGTIAQAAQGAATGAGAELTADVGFAPDLVLVWPTSTNNNVWLWASTASTINTRLSDGTSIDSNRRLTVSGDVITFPDNPAADAPNRTGVTFSYVALRFNATAINPS